MSARFRYELRVVNDWDYNSHADTGFLSFTNGVTSAFGPAGHSDREFVGQTVLCRLRQSTQQDGYYFDSMAVVIEFAPRSKRPVEYGRILTNRSQGGFWIPPGKDDRIYDERNKP